MGRSSKALLCYGYLCAEDFGYELPQAPDWAQPGLPIEFAAMDELLAKAGFVEQKLSSPGYLERRRAAEQALGIDFVNFGHTDEKQGIIVSARTVEAGTSSPQRIAEFVVDPEADLRLARAMTQLGVTGEGPGWFLASYYA
jgi:hypothetical protein